MHILLAQSLPTLPPDTPWFIVVVVVIIFLCAPFISRVIDTKFEAQAKQYEERMAQLKADAIETAATTKTIDTLVNTLTHFTNAMNARDAREFDERALFREVIGKNTQGLTGVELAMRTMAATLLGLKEGIDRWPIDIKQIMLEAISEDRAKRNVLTNEVPKVPTSNPPDSPNTVTEFTP